MAQGAMDGRVHSYECTFLRSFFSICNILPVIWILKPKCVYMTRVQPQAENSSNEMSTVETLRTKLCVPAFHFCPLSLRFFSPFSCFPSTKWATDRVRVCWREGWVDSACCTLTFDEPSFWLVARITTARGLSAQRFRSTVHSKLAGIARYNGKLISPKDSALGYRLKHYRMLCGRAFTSSPLRIESEPLSMFQLPLRKRDSIRDSEISAVDENVTYCSHFTLRHLLLNYQNCIYAMKCSLNSPFHQLYHFYDQCERDYLFENGELIINTIARLFSILWLFFFLLK